MDKDYSISSQTLYFRAILEELKVKKPYLAGNSMGGAIIALYAALYPDDVAGITLLNPGGIKTYESDLDRYLARGENPLIVKTSGDLQKLMDFFHGKAALSALAHYQRDGRKVRGQPGDA
jgi:abhydrolase domain-containing protein 6